MALYTLTVRQICVGQSLPLGGRWPEGYHFFSHVLEGKSSLALHSSTGPGVDDFRPAPFEIPCVPGYDWCPPGPCDGGDLTIGLAYGSSGSLALSNQHCVSQGGIAVKWQDSLSE